MAIDIERISRLEGTYEQGDRRLDDMHQAIEGVRAETQGLRTEMNSRFEEMNRRFEDVNNRLDNRFNIIIVVMIAAWATVIAALITLALQ